MTKKQQTSPVGLRALRGYLAGEQWDHTPRLDTFLADYAGVKGSKPIVSALGRFLLCEVVGVPSVTPALDYSNPIRLSNPIVLYGVQGVGKSTFVKDLALDGYSDNLEDSFRFLSSKRGNHLVHEFTESGLDQHELVEQVNTVTESLPTGKSFHPIVTCNDMRPHNGMCLQIVMTNYDREGFLDIKGQLFAELADSMDL